MVADASPSAAVARDPIFVRAKLYAPLRRTGVVRRGRLIEALDAVMPAPQQIGLITAPAGFGKTTLITQWLEERGRVAAWVTFDPSDEEPAIFWSYIIEALHTRHPAVGPRALRELRSGGTVDSARVGALLLGELDALQEQVILVLDDLHAIASRECLGGLNQFLQGLPPNVRVILSSRSAPSLSLARFRAKGQLTELQIDDLRFTAEESERMLNAEEGLGLSESDVSRLHSHTEGWPAALYLAALSMRDSPPAARSLLLSSGAMLHLVEYVDSEVLGDVDPQARAFLTLTSVVERLTPALADAMTGRDDSEGLLQALWQSNRLVVAVDEPDRWYRYHPLLRESLQSELHRRGHDAAQLHLRAARWFESEGLYFAAVEHALRAGAAETAAAMISEHRVELIRTGLAGPIQKWLDQIPDEVARGVVGLPLLAIGCLNALDGDSPAFARWERLARDAADANGRFPGVHGDEAPLSVLLSIRAAVSGKSTEACVVAARALIADEEPDTLWWRFGQAQLACALYMQQGATPDVLRAATAALDPMGPSPYPIADIQALGVLALHALDTGDLTAARAIVGDALARVVEASRETSPQAAMAHIAAGRLHAREGNFAEAEAEVRHGLSLRQADPSRIWYVHGLVSLAEVRDLGGDVPGALDALAEAKRLLPVLLDAGRLPSMLQAVESTVRTRRAPVALSPAESRVLRLLAGPLSQGDIGRELFLSRNTVKSHTRSLYRKLGVATRADAVAAARLRGWLG